MGRQKELIFNTLIIGIGKFSTQVVSVFLLPMYTSILSTSEYGTYDLLNLNKISRQDAGNKIRSEIKSVESKVNELAQLGYQVYPRNSSSDIYKLDNISEYFIGEDNVIYVIFAYGNKSNTNEKDIIIM